MDEKTMTTLIGGCMHLTDRCASATETALECLIKQAKINKRQRRFNRGITVFATASYVWLLLIAAVQNEQINELKKEVKELKKEKEGE